MTDGNKGEQAMQAIIDADTGIDDALAILYAAKAPGLQLAGITTVFGNISVEQATDNTLRILHLAGTGGQIPVVPGADRPLRRPLEGFASNVHGANGIGDVELPPSPQQPLPELADAFIVRQADRLDGQLVLITLGRLTNLAKALDRDPQLAGKIKQVYVMGGAVGVPGNVTPVAEANIWGDPEAAQQVFASGLPITMVGLDVTMKTHLTEAQLDWLVEHSNEQSKPMASFIRTSYRNYIDFYRQSNYFLDYAPLHDPLTVLAALDPNLVTTRPMRVTVECESELCAGMTVADRRRVPAIGAPIQVCTEVDAELAVGKLLSALIS